MIAEDKYIFLKLNVPHLKVCRTMGLNALSQHPLSHSKINTIFKVQSQVNLKKFKKIKVHYPTQGIHGVDLHTGHHTAELTKYFYSKVNFKKKKKKQVPPPPTHLPYPPQGMHEVGLKK